MSSPGTVRGRPLAGLLPVGFLLGAALLVLPGVLGAVPIAGGTSAGTSAPLARLHDGLPAVAAHPAPAASSPLVRGHPIGYGTALGGSWGPSFAQDVNVTFSIPYVGTRFFLTAPSTNAIPESATGFWMNITAVAPLVYANVTIWGTQWPVQNRTTSIPSFPVATGPNNVRPMLINASRNTTASFYFDDYRYFWPGDRVDFNLTVTALVHTDATVYSTQVDSYVDPANSTNFATWIAEIGSPWASPDFSSSIVVTTTPNVIGSPAYDPNPYQPLQVSLSALVPAGNSVATIPAAVLYATIIQNGFTANKTIAFTPTNGSVVQLAQPLGPYPNSTIVFNVLLWLPWLGGAIDRMYSPYYTFNWSKNGGWWYPNQGLLSNLELSTFPYVLPPAPGSVPVGQPVNVSIHETKPNVTLGPAQVNYIFTDQLGSHAGVLGMQAADPNTSFALIPGLPPGAHLVFSVTAKDIFGNPIFSKNYSYSATRAPAPPGYPRNHGFFFFEALDVAGSGLVPNLNFTLENGSWSESGAGRSLGFGGAVVPDGNNYLALGFGQYLLTITAFGRSYSTSVSVQNGTPFTIVFYVASAPIPSNAVSSLPIVTIGEIAGLGGAILVLLVVWPWFRERRKRIEAEQRRITL